MTTATTAAAATTRLDNRAMTYPPVDFSFRDLHHCSEIANVEPRKGYRRKIRNVSQDNPKQQSSSSINNNSTRREQSSTIGTIKYGTGAREELKKLTEKDEHISMFLNGDEDTDVSDANTEEEHSTVQQYTGYMGSSVKLSNNYLTSVDGLEDALASIMFDCEGVKWLDLSFNQIETLESIESLNYTLENLQLHSNNIFNINEVMRLAKFRSLKSLTLHGNPVEETKNYRYCVIAILPWLKSLDFNHITTKDRDTAETFKKLFIEPLIKKQVVKMSRKK